MIISVGRILRAVVQALGGGETCFRSSAARRDGVDVKFIVALADERQRLSIRRPAVPVRRRIFRDAPGSATANRHDIDQGMVVFLRLVADGKLGGVRAKCRDRCCSA